MVNHLLLAEKVKAEEEFKKQKYIAEKITKEMERAKIPISKTIGEVSLDGTPEVVGDMAHTYDKLKSKIVYKTGGDKYLTRGKDLITRVGEL